MQTIQDLPSHQKRLPELLGARKERHLHEYKNFSILMTLVNLKSFERRPHNNKINISDLTENKQLIATMKRENPTLKKRENQRTR
jgi:hypothetical protein